jgi:hypothetical protein
MTDTTTTEPAKAEQELAVPVTFAVTTYWKRPRNAPGFRTMASRRLDIGQALQWILNELPEDAFEVTYLDENGRPHEGEYSDRVRLDIDWTKVPVEIREGPTFLPASQRR